VRLRSTMRTAARKISLIFSIAGPPLVTRPLYPVTIVDFNSGWAYNDDGPRHSYL
jgi:hypothetical protein